MKPHWNKTSKVKKAGCFLKIIFRQIDNYLLRFDETNLNLEFPNCGGKDFFFFANAISGTLYLSVQDLAKHECEKKWK